MNKVHYVIDTGMFHIKIDNLKGYKYFDYDDNEWTNYGIYNGYENTKYLLEYE